MVGTYTLPKDTLSEVLKSGGRSWQRGGAAFGLVCGLLAPILGSILSVLSWVIDPSWHGVHLQTVGTVLFVLTIPLLLLGAHCLDLLEKEKTQSRRDTRREL